LGLALLKAAKPIDIEALIGRTQLDRAWLDIDRTARPAEMILHILPPSVRGITSYHIAIESAHKSYSQRKSAA